MTNDVLQYNLLSTDDYKKVNDDLKNKDTMEVIKWSYDTFGDDLIYACSFGAEAIVLIDLIYKVRKNASIVFLDTDFHFHETYELIEKVKKRYPQLSITMKKPKLTPEEQAEQYGEKLWETNPDQCCNIRKVEPLWEVLSGATAWMSGLRREQSPTRANTEYINQDNKFKSIKICPLIHWTWKEVWQYIDLNNLDYNLLHDKRYPSIGCKYCTTPVTVNSSSREGRWSGTAKKECGLHA